MQHSYCARAGFTICYAFVGALRRHAFRRRVNLRYHRRDTRCRAACPKFPVAGPASLARIERFAPVRAPQSAALVHFRP